MCAFFETDIKFENLLLKVAGDLDTVKIVDFGFAKKLFDMRKGVDTAAHHTVCGSPHYVAPELVDDKSTAVGGAAYGSQADMWSFGVLIFRLLSGCVTPAAVIRRCDGAASVALCPSERTPTS